MGLFDAMRGSVGLGGASNAGRMNRMNPAGSRFGDIGAAAGNMGGMMRGSIGRGGSIGPSFMGGGMGAPNLGPAFGGAIGSIFGRRPSINEGGGIRFRPKRPFFPSKRGPDEIMTGGTDLGIGRGGGMERMPRIIPNPEFEDFYQKQRDAGKDFPGAMDEWQKQRGSMGPTGGFGGMVGRLGKRQRRMAAEAARAQAAAPAVEG